MKTPTIEGRTLTEHDIGSPVTYKPNHALNDRTQWERGFLSSFNESGIWVKFKSANGEKCNPENLVWG